jgi:hypothetical protein
MALVPWREVDDLREDVSSEVVDLSLLLDFVDGIHSILVQDSYLQRDFSSTPKISLAMVLFLNLVMVEARCLF